MGSKARELEKSDIDKILKMKVAALAETELAAPILVTPKKEDLLHFCGDYRKLNAMNIRDSYAILRMDECIDFYGGL